MLKNISKYYLFGQLVGWGIVFLYLMAIGPIRMGNLVVTILTGILISHLIRMVIIRRGWLGLPVRSALSGWVVVVAMACVVAAVIGGIGMSYFEGRQVTLLPEPGGIVKYVLLLAPWTACYWFCCYAGKTSRENVKNKQLLIRAAEMEKQVKESEADAGMIPDRLKRIGEALDKDPERSKEEITEFSKLLRKGYARGR